MKTLDEVIAMLEAYPVTPSSLDFDVTIVRVSDIDDVLHYLKEYRERKEMLRYWGEKAISEQQNVADAYMLYKIALEKKQENLPLTWQELLQMEGKPVWVEQRYQKMWGLNDGTYLDAFGDDCITIKVLHDLCHFEKKLIGITWQAYRKER